MARIKFPLSTIALSVGLVLAAQAHAAASGQREAMDPNAVSRLVADSGGNVQVAISSATGTANFVTVATGGKLGARGTVKARAVNDAAKQASAVQFLADYASVFGITNVASELRTGIPVTDRLGTTHISHVQVYQGVPVFGGELKTHFDAAGNLTAVTGTFIPNITVTSAPARSADQAAAVALARVKADLGKSIARSAAISAAAPTLMIYRENLAKGVDGDSHLTWQVVVGNGHNVREFVYVDALSGKVVDKITGVYDALNRRAFDGANSAAEPGPNYPNSPFWVEGQAFPTGLAEADNMILASGDIYNMFKKAFGRDSYDGNGATMVSIFNRGWSCPNASWNGGTYISFCPGLTTDDVTAHEWGHAYTQYTHGLIYAWQPGALNEAYSDIWGETVDRINGRGTDTPDTPRTANACTVFTSATQVAITAPSSIAGVKVAGTAAFGPQTFSIANTDVVVINDGSATPTFGCTAGAVYANAAAVAGKIALVDRGNCSFDVKTKNAQANGAIGVIIGNNVAGVINMSASDPLLGVTIPALSVSLADATAIKGAAGVKATLQRGPGSDNSVRWLLGEDSTATGLTGALRDMYNPTCYGNPGKVTDAQYSCGPNTQAGDSGGVHNNSGVPNHGYALLVDGGTYNGQSITGIGLTKAAHIYWRAQSVYQNTASDFAAHASSIEQSCRDLTGASLNGLTTGTPSGEVITAADCAQVVKMTAAVEMRTPPTACNFTTILAQTPPALCTTGTVDPLLFDTFDAGRRSGVKWLVSHAGVSPEFTARDWGVVNNLPSGRPGYAMYASDPNIGTCAVGSDQSGVQVLESQEITIPANSAAARMSFDHYVATEAGYDGGNVKISVGGGAWQLITAANFIYNPYNTTLTTAAAGNTNPLAGQAAFSGSDGGSVAGSWGRSIINLAPYATAGQKFKLRFESGMDGCGGTFGWYVDDVQVYRCTP